MTVTAGGFKTLLPEFSCMENSRVDMFLSLAVLRVSPAQFTDLTDFATYYLAAHLLSTVGAGTSGASSPSGPVTSEKVGEVAITYAAPAQMKATDAEYATTKYGREYLAMRNERVMALVVPGMENYL